MYKLRRKLFSQNFLHNRKLITKLLGSSSLGKNDLVLEIGPGKGIITEQLMKQTQHVIAVELDTQWYNYLLHKFATAINLTLCNADFLGISLPTLPYKVFANIPFAIEGKIMRKLIDAKNPPDDCYLVLMKEFAYRMSAPYRENQFSISHKPWFEFSIYHHFKQTDFTPVPNVSVVMVRFIKRTNPLIPWGEISKYQAFVANGFGQGQSLKYNLKKHYGRKRVAYLLKKLHIQEDIKPSFLTLEQWITLYNVLGNNIR